MLDDNKRRARLSRDLQRRAAITFVTEKGGSIAYIRQVNSDNCVYLMKYADTSNRGSIHSDTNFAIQ